MEGQRFRRSRGAVKRGPPPASRAGPGEGLVMTDADIDGMGTSLKGVAFASTAKAPERKGEAQTCGAAGQGKEA